MSTPPTSYDPNGSSETTGIPQIPGSPLIKLSDRAVLQPPLSRRGKGPGLIVLFPGNDGPKWPEGEAPLDPEPVQKWAEEGYAVVGILLSAHLTRDLELAKQALDGLDIIEEKGKYGLIAYNLLSTRLLADLKPELHKYGIKCAVTISTMKAELEPMPVLCHIPAEDENEPPSSEKLGNLLTFTYPGTGNHFILPQMRDTYKPGAAALAHTRTLVFLREHLGGPHFDLESIWDEHTKFEFAERSVARTMATMVAEPYVNHVPTMIGGMGRKSLTEFYRDNFIFWYGNILLFKSLANFISNPPDAALNTISRTVGPDRVVDEFIFSCTHSSVIPWLLPGVPPTNVKINVPFVAVVNIRGDRLYHEHIWWDQATLLRQIGVLPSHVEHNGQQQKLPVAGAEQAQLLLGTLGVKGNQMLDSNWTSK